MRGFAILAVLLAGCVEPTRPYTAQQTIDAYNECHAAGLEVVFYRPSTIAGSAPVVSHQCMPKSETL